MTDQEVPEMGHRKLAKANLFHDFFSFFFFLRDEIHLFGGDALRDGMEKNTETSAPNPQIPSVFLPVNLREEEEEKQHKVSKKLLLLPLLL